MRVVFSCLIFGISFANCGEDTARESRRSAAELLNPTRSTWPAKISLTGFDVASFGVTKYEGTWDVAIDFFHHRLNETPSLDAAPYEMIDHVEISEVGYEDVPNSAYQQAVYHDFPDGDELVIRMKVRHHDSDDDWIVGEEVTVPLNDSYISTTSYLSLVPAVEVLDAGSRLVKANFKLSPRCEIVVPTTNTFPSDVVGVAIEMKSVSFPLSAESVSNSEADIWRIHKQGFRSGFSRYSNDKERRLGTERRFDSANWAQSGGEKLLPMTFLIENAEAGEEYMAPPNEYVIYNTYPQFPRSRNRFDFERFDSNEAYRMSMVIEKCEDIDYQNREIQTPCTGETTTLFTENEDIVAPAIDPRDKETLGIPSSFDDKKLWFGPAMSQLFMRRKEEFKHDYRDKDGNLLITANFVRRPVCANYFDTRLSLF